MPHLTPDLPALRDCQRDIERWIATGKLPQPVRWDAKRSLADLLARIRGWR